MTDKHDDYDNFEDTLSKTNESIYLHPVVDDNDETKPILPLLDDSNNNQQSPYEEVAANVSNKDNPAMICLTFRSVFIGILLTCVMSFASQFFAFRTLPLDLNTGVIILLSFMIGKLMSKVLPEKIFRLTLNPGRFSIKEHALATIMATSGTSTIFGIEAITVQRLYYNLYHTHFNAILFLLIMHLLAFSIAGILKRYLVWPASMIWPSALLSCGLIRTLDAEDDIEKDKSRWKMKRSTFFWVAVLCQFLWYWFPGYIFPVLSAFSFICMISPNKIILSQVTGANGLGLGALQFDWNAIVSYLGSPILVPFWAHVNMFIGYIMVAWIVTPILYYSNVWQSKKMPIVSTRVFDSDGNFYNTTEVLNENLRLNETAYEIYGPIHMTTAYAVSYGFVFAGASALIVHTILYNGKSIVKQFRANLSDKQNDIHAKLMSHYPEIPEWSYYILLLLSSILGLVYFYTSAFTSGFIMIVVLIINFIWVTPIGIIAAVTSITMLSGVAFEIFGGLILHGNPIGFIVFRTFTGSCQYQVLALLVNFKIAHYMKIPPRTAIPLMMLCIVISSIIHYITAIYLLHHVPNICTSKNPQWRCLIVESSYTLSIIWGIIGTARTFGSKSEYFPLIFGFVIGIFLPILSWILWKKWSNIKWLELISFPIILLSTTNFPPAPGAEYPTWFIVGFIFSYIMYRYAHLWWEKYAYIFSAAMSCGVAICGLLIFFIFQLNNINFPEWWGTGGPMRDGCPLATTNYAGIRPMDDNL